LSAEFSINFTEEPANETISDHFGGELSAKENEKKLEQQTKSKGKRTVHCRTLP